MPPSISPGVLSLLLNFQNGGGWGGLPGSPYLEGVAGKERGDLFQEGLQFYKKNKLKSEMFKDKKNL